MLEDISTSKSFHSVHDMEHCRLPASGFTETLSPVYDWAKAIVSDMRKQLSSEKIKADLWAYREQSCEWLCLDISEVANGSLIFLIGEPHNYSLNSPATVINVPDMTEALHMAGIICDALGAKIEIGRRNNEVNPYCTPSKWTPGQTNARLQISFEGQ